MPNGHSPNLKEYGGHKYADHDGTSNCQYNCGCWMGPARSGGPAGLDPGGTCPNNPTDGKFLGGKADYEYVVNERINKLLSRLYETEVYLKKVSPSKIKLAEKLASTEAELTRKKQLLDKLRRLIESGT